jgi:hypothetical protein
MPRVPFDVSKVPSDVALVLTQQRQTRLLVTKLANVMGLTVMEANLMHHEIVGAIAAVVDNYLRENPSRD